MSEEIANKLNASYKSSVDSTNKAMNEISKAFGHSWTKVGGGVKTLSTNVQKTMEQAWADTSQDTQKLMYDMRACFDNSWSMNEAGVTNLAEMTQGTVKDGYAEIDSSSSNTFGENGQLKTDADNSWKNVEPGATNLANNMQWVMDQSYNAIKAGCTAAVTSIKNDLATTGDAFEAVATKAEKAKQETQQQQQTAQQPAKQKGALENIAEGAGQFIRGVGQGIADVVTAPFKFLGSLLGFASGTKEIKKSNFANVDEQGPEMLVRKPDSGRYTYLETGDGVVLLISHRNCLRWVATRMHGSRNRCQSTVLNRLFRVAVEMLQLRLAILLSRILLAALTLWRMKSNRSYRLRLLKCKASGK